jgi:galactose mutarotase-like enzyme
MSFTAGPPPVPQQRRGSTVARSAAEVRSWHLVREDEEHGITSAVMAPSWGANVLAVSLQHPDLAWPIQLLESMDLATIALKPTSYGVPLLAPTPGRLSGDVLRYEGRSYRAVPTRHGFLRSRPWETIESSPDAVVCALDVDPGATPDGAFPFALKARYEVQLVNGGFRGVLRVENSGTQKQPFAAGWHPYLYRSQACALHIPAASRWETNADVEPTPTGRIVSVEDQDDFHRARQLGWDEHWDETFTDLPQGPVSCWTEEIAPVRTHAGGKVMARVRRVVSFSAGEGRGTRPLHHVQLYTPPSRQAICIEPLSAPPDAINLLAAGNPRADVCELEPGEEAIFEAEFRIELSLL